MLGLALPLIAGLARGSTGGAGRLGLLAAAAIFSISPMTLSPLGVLNQEPRFLWIVTTALMPTFGLWWLASRCHSH